MSCSGVKRKTRWLNKLSRVMDTPTTSCHHNYVRRDFVSFSVVSHLLYDWVQSRCWWNERVVEVKSWSDQHICCGTVYSCTHTPTVAIFIFMTLMYGPVLQLMSTCLQGGVQRLRGSWEWVSTCKPTEFLDVYWNIWWPSGNRRNQRAEEYKWSNKGCWYNIRVKSFQQGDWVQFR